MADQREVREGRQEIGLNEEYVWQIKTYVKDENGSYVNPSSLGSVKVESLINGTYTDKTSTILSGAGSTSGRNLILPKWQKGTATVGVKYLLIAPYVVGGNTFEELVWIEVVR